MWRPDGDFGFIRVRKHSAEEGMGSLTESGESELTLPSQTP